MANETRLAPSLLVLTDRTLLSPGWTLAQAVAPAITGGATLLAYRETDLPPTPRLAVARFVLQAAAGQVPVLAAGTLPEARKMGFQGALCEPGDGCLFHPGIGEIVIQTAVTLDDARRASSMGAHFVLIRLDWCNPGESLRAVSEFVRVAGAEGAAGVLPGIDMPPELAGECMAAGARGAAICRPAMAGPNRTQAVRDYAHAIGSQVTAGSDGSGTGEAR